MKIALIGYGGMGRAVERVALERGHEVGVFGREISVEALLDYDLAIDCSLREGVLSHARMCASASKNLVIVASNWYDLMPEMKAMVEASEIGVIWSGNFSIGVNLFLKMVARAAEFVNDFEEYDVWGHEIHHNQKVDSPSATAKLLEEILLAKIERKTAVVEDRLERKREDHEIHFSSLRGGQVNFKHEIGFDSAADTITITHSARSRDGYALGAVKAAEWIVGKRGLFGMEDFMKN